MQVIDTGFTNWVTQLAADINDPAALAYIGSYLPDGRLKVTNIGDRAYAGGLVTAKRPLPGFSGAPPVPAVACHYAMLSAGITVSATSVFNLARLETDLIVVFKPAPNATTIIANKANGSTQLNLSSGHFEIDASPGQPVWSDIGGGPGKITADVEHSLVIRYFFDLANAKVSVLSISWDAVRYPVPEGLRKVSFQSSNWATVAALQLQSEIFNPGSVDVLYRNVTLTWSDQPL